ncbi:MAG: ArsR family transcriptional regulator [Kofleriaceae bacterium]|nr:ArsR family transcriptional regulator [Myxococcales bacterium]MCB9559229.1 ArsR family transcriptional regulator [Kofleriaceae bacterium]MCB9574880.1 ArsR family transcriptional regulator [Kofleriaceae bacterium]
MADGKAPAPPSPMDAAALRIADAVGALMESWGFKRNMGRLWTVLYLENRPLSAAEIGERLSLSSGAVSMLLGEMQAWAAVKKAWVPGERREYYEPETSIWKMVSRVFRERELRWVQTALEAFEEGQAELEGDAGVPDDPERAQLIRDRVAGLTELTRVTAHLLEAALRGESVDALPLKTVGELAKAARRSDLAGRGGGDEEEEEEEET